MNERVRVLIVDDHSVVRQGVKAFLELQETLEVVGEAESGENALALVERLRPDVVILDLLMAGMNGIETTRRIKAVSPDARVVILTSHLGEEQIVPAIRAGAVSYLFKSVTPRELVEAVVRAAKGETTFSLDVASRLVHSLGPDAPQTTGQEALSPREMDVLRLIAEGLSNQAIGERLFISEKTVKSHVGNLLGKLGLTDRTQAAIFAWKNGLVEFSSRAASPELRLKSE